MKCYHQYIKKKVQYVEAQFLVYIWDCKAVNTGRRIWEETDNDSDNEEPITQLVVSWRHYPKVIQTDRTRRCLYLKTYITMIL
jgi:hypothetical protein